LTHKTGPLLEEEGDFPQGKNGRRKITVRVLGGNAPRGDVNGKFRKV